MPAHDIIDNRNEKLCEHVNRILGSTGAARFAVGYFFVSGLMCIADKFGGVAIRRNPSLGCVRRWGLTRIEGWNELE